MKPSSAFAGVVLAMLTQCPGIEAALAATCDASDVALATTPAPPQNRGALRRVENLSKAPPSHASVVFIGDSLIELWPSPLLRAAAPNQTVVNLGVGGNKTQHTLYQLRSPNLRDEHPEEVVLLIGTNNLGAGEQPCGIVAGIEAISAKLQTLWPRAKFRYLAIPPRGTDFAFRDAERRTVNDAIARLAQKTTGKFIALDDAVKCRPNEPCRFYRDDRLHFTDEGYQALASALLSARVP